MADYHLHGSYDLEEDRIEEPIIPMSQLGATVPERDPRTGAHVLQNIESTIRKGASKMQLMWQTPSTQPVGGRPKAYGKDVREAIREMLKANDVELSAAELPPGTSLSGFDAQRGVISEEARRRDLQEVKDAIDFQVEAAGGGGVDIWSQEYTRSITDDDDINKDRTFYDYSPDELKYEREVQKAVEDPTHKVERDPRIEGVKLLYDERTGQVLKDIRKSSIIHSPKYLNAEQIQEKHSNEQIIGRYDERKAEATGGKDPYIREDDYVSLEGKWLDPNNPEDQLERVPVWDEEKSRFESETLKWPDIVRKTKEHNEGLPEDEWLKPEQMAFNLQLDNQIMQSRGMSLHYSQGYERQLEGIKALQEKKKEFEQKKEQLSEVFKGDDEGYAFALKQEARKLAQEIDPRRAPEAEHNPEKFFDSEIKQLQHHIKHTHEASASADARADELAEMKEHVKTPDQLAKKNTTDSYADLGVYAMEKSQDPRAERDVYVGPELGWPTAYGGHPQEFIDIIKESRKKMAEKLVKEQDMREEEAKEAAKKHIRGDFDTSHLAMWYQHFQGKEGESEEQKLKRFNEWYMDMAEKLQKEDVVGSIQLVDSIGGQHSHLPAGQGVFPVSKAVQQMWEQGWRGDIVSEGHEEEQFGEGRILTETWKEFGSPIGTGSYWGGTQGSSWRGVQGSYFGATAPPTYIVGSYVPSNDWQLWSEVPFE